MSGLVLAAGVALHHGAPTLVWLGAAAVALVAAAVAAAIWLRADGGRAATAAPARLPMLCPACGRGYPAGTRFCAADAYRLVAEGEGAVAERGSSGKCPRCRRAYEAGLRFCPLDAEELVPLPQWHATHPEGGVQVEEDSGVALHPRFDGDAKICPRCAARYDLEASFCGRDGVELVSVN